MIVCPGMAANGAAVTTECAKGPRTDAGVGFQSTVMWYKGAGICIITYLSICLYVRLSIYLSVYLSVYLSIYLYVCVYVTALAVVIVIAIRHSH